VAGALSRKSVSSSLAAQAVSIQKIYVLYVVTEYIYEHNDYHNKQATANGTKSI